MGFFYLFILIIFCYIFMRWYHARKIPFFPSSCCYRYRVMIPLYHELYVFRDRDNEGKERGKKGYMKNHSHIHKLAYLRLVEMSIYNHVYSSLVPFVVVLYPMTVMCACGTCRRVSFIHCSQWRIFNMKLFSTFKGTFFIDWKLKF